MSEELYYMKDIYLWICEKMLTIVVELNKGGDLEMRGENYYSNLLGTEPRGYCPNQ